MCLITRKPQARFSFSTPPPCFKLIILLHNWGDNEEQSTVAHKTSRLL
jgi:hypothetical protein